MDQTTSFADLVEKYATKNPLSEREEGIRRRRVLLASKLVKDGDKFTTADAVRVLSDYRQGVVVNTDSARLLLENMVAEGSIIVERSSTGKARVRYMKAPETSLSKCWKPTANTIPLGRYYPNA